MEISQLHISAQLSLSLCSLASLYPRVLQKSAMIPTVTAVCCNNMFGSNTLWVWCWHTQKKEKLLGWLSFQMFDVCANTIPEFHYQYQNDTFPNTLLFLQNFFSLSFKYVIKNMSRRFVDSFQYSVTHSGTEKNKNRNLKESNFQIARVGILIILLTLTL